MKPPTTRAKRLACFAVALVIAAGGIAYLQFLWPPRFAVVEQGVLYRSSQPSIRQLQHMVDALGIKTILIVRSGKSDRVPDEIDYARAKGLTVIHIPIESRKPIPDSQIAQFFQVVDDKNRQPILVHCSAGRHRTGYLCARYRVDRQGWPLQKAVDELISFGFDEEDQAVVLEQLKAYKPVGGTTADRTPVRTTP